jgi:hypothetical protein
MSYFSSAYKTDAASTTTIDIKRPFLYRMLLMDYFNTELVNPFLHHFLAAVVVLMIVARGLTVALF